MRPLSAVLCALVILTLAPQAVSGSIRIPTPVLPEVSNAFGTTSQFTMDGVFGVTEWGTTSSAAQGVFMLQDVNINPPDGSGFNGTAADINYYWQAATTASGATPASPSNQIEYMCFRFDTFSGGPITSSKYWVQLNLGQASFGYADHLLAFFVANTGSPQVTVVLYSYPTPYPAMKAFTDGTITARVSNAAGYGAQDPAATAGYGIVSGTNYGIEAKIPIGWFGPAYGGLVAADGSGSPLTGAVFSSTGSFGAVGTPKDALSDAGGGIIDVASTSTGSTTYFNTTITKLAFTTPAQNIAANTASSIITVQTQDAGGLVEVYGTATTINLTSSSPTGTFSLSASNWVNITSVTISKSGSSASFYYKDTAAGTPTITADENPSLGWTAATQTETVGIAKLVFTTPAQNIPLSTASEIMTIQAQTAASVALNLSAPVTVSLTSTSAGGVFSLSNTSWVNITSVQIPAGSNSFSFYYKDSTAGNPTLTGAENPSLGWTDATQQQAVGIAKLVFTTSAQTIQGNTPSTIITVQAQSAGGAAIILSAPVTLNLTSSSTFGFFSLLASPWANITTLGIPAGASSSSFYYKDTRAGTPTITADENPSLGWTAATQQETITGTIAITNTPGSYAFGVINLGSTNSTGLTYFTVTNTGNIVVTVTIVATNMTGGVTWTLASSTGPNQYALRAGISGSYSVTVTASAAILVTTLDAGASQTWGLQLLAPTSFTDGVSKSGTVTLSATAY